MGVDVSNYTYIGKYVDNAEQYLIELGLLKEGQLSEEFYGDFTLAFDDGYLPLEVCSVSCYSNQGYYVGFEVKPSDYKLFDGLLEKFKSITGEGAGIHSFSHWH